MRACHRPGTSHAQHGAAILLVMIIVAVGTATFFLLRQINGARLQVERDQITAAALAQAKAALIGRSVADDNRPGSMPCPDTNDDGSAEIFSGSTCPSYVGRLPWRTLGLPDLRDGNGERLWLAISPSYRDNIAAEPVNPFLTAPDLTLDNPAGPGKYVALILAPGAAVCNQDRSAANRNDATHYLELDNNNADNHYLSRSNIANSCEAQNFNDKIISITPADLQPLIQKRFARIQQEAVVKLQAYFNACGALPWAMTFQDPSSIPSGGFASTTNVREGLFPADLARPWNWGSNCGSSNAPQFIRLNQNNWYTTFPNLLRNSPLYYAIGTAYSPGQPGACSAATDCLSVFNRDTMTLTQNIPALLIYAGSALAGQTRPSANRTDYFESRNTSAGDDNFAYGSADATFNDTLIQITP